MNTAHEPSPGQLELALLRANLPMPLLADDGIHSPEDVLQCIRANAAAWVSIKSMKYGG